MRRSLGPIIGSSGPSVWLGPLCYSVLGAVASRVPWAVQLLIAVVRVVASYFWSVREVSNATQPQEAIVAANAAVLRARARAQPHGRTE